MFQIVEMFKDGLAEWWMKSGVLRKLGDTLVAFMLTIGVTVGYMAYESKEPIMAAFERSISRPKLNAIKAKDEIEDFLRGATFRGAIAVAVLQVDINENRRGILTWQSLPEYRERFQEAVERQTNVPFIGDGAFDLASMKAIIEGRPYWLPSMVTDELRLVVPIPPIYRQETVGVLSVTVRRDTSQTNREVLESQAMAWAYALGN